MSPETIDAMLAAGASAEVIAAAWKSELIAQGQKTEHRRTLDRTRQQQRRSRGVTRTERDAPPNDSILTPPSSKNKPKGLEKDPPIVAIEKKQAIATCLQKAFPVQYGRFPDAWNEMARKHGLPTVEACAGKRLKALKARIAEHGEDAALRAIANVPGSPHWLGENGWLGNFDSLMRPDNFQRMLEGAYGSKTSHARITDPTVIAANKRRTAELYTQMGRDQEADELLREAVKIEQGIAA